MTAIEFGVRGMPVPQGSGRSFVAGGRAVHVTTSSPLLAWRGAIAKAAQDALGGAPLERGPLAVTLAFRPRPRPASHFLPANSRRPVRVQRADAPIWFAGRPDADKLARAALDAMTGVVYEDDEQAVRLVVEKRWPDEGEAPGVDIRVRTLEETCANDDQPWPCDYIAALEAAGVRVAPSPLEKFDIAGMTQAEQEPVAPSPDAPGLADRIRRRLANESEGNVYLDISWVMSIIAEEAALALPPRDALDVERLAESMKTLLFYDDFDAFWRPFAAMVAREYAATPEEPSDD